MRKVLVANRGEIARRILRGCRALGLETIAVYSEADARAAHVEEADEARLIGPAPARDSYLKADRVLQVASDCRADAIHPGYGLLSENAGFAEQVEAAGLTWIGPAPRSIREMGRSEEHTSELQSLMRISYAVFCLKKK